MLGPWRGGGDQLLVLQSPRGAGLSGGAWLVLTAETGKPGEYSCEYWALRDRRHIYSARSQPVQVPVMDFPVAPSISTISDPPGMSPVTILCSAPPGHVATRYQFLRQGNVIVSQLGARLQLHQSDLDAAGPYTCSYEISVSGRMIQSLPSAPLSIHLTGPFMLPESFQPTLRLFPMGPEFTTGESVTLTCSAPSWEKKMQFCFLKAGEQVACTRQVLEDSQSYQIGRLGMEDSGSYTCMYHVAEPGQEISSLESQPISIRVTGVPLPPPAPEIILDPAKRIYFLGEHVKLTCSVPGSEQVRGYRFYHQRREQISELDEGPWLERTAMIGNAGAYSCAYWIIRSGQAILSGKSNSICITVSAPPLAPRLSLDPKLPVYLPGEKVTLNCSAPQGEEVVGFRFHQHRGKQTPEELPAASGGPWMELTAQMGNDGSYTCQYWRREAGQEIVSETSNSITVAVSDPPPQPALSVDPPSGAVNKGLPLLITCTAPEDASKQRFHFYKDGAELIPGDMGSEISTMEPSTGSTNVSVLSIPWAGPKSTGEFTCGYKKNMSGRWIPSPRSRAVNVTVTAKASPASIQAWSPWIPLVAGCIGAAALLPLLLLLICLCRRRKGGIAAETHPLYVSRPSSTGTVLQQWSHDGQVHPVTHNHPALPSDPGGKPRVGRIPQERGKRDEDADATEGHNSLMSNPVYSVLTLSSPMAQQRGGKYISEAAVYAEILH